MPKQPDPEWGDKIIPDDAWVGNYASDADSFKKLHEIAVDPSQPMERRLQALSEMDYGMGVKGPYPTGKDLKMYLAEAGIDFKTSDSEQQPAIAGIEQTDPNDILNSKSMEDQILDGWEQYKTNPSPQLLKQIQDWSKHVGVSLRQLDVRLARRKLAVGVVTNAPFAPIPQRKAISIDSDEAEAEIKRWFQSNGGRFDDATKAAEACAEHLGHEEWLDEELHPVWEMAYEYVGKHDPSIPSGERNGQAEDRDAVQRKRGMVALTEKYGESTAKDLLGMYVMLCKSGDTHSEAMNTIHGEVLMKRQMHQPGIRGDMSHLFSKDRPTDGRDAKTRTAGEGTPGFDVPHEIKYTLFHNKDYDEWIVKAWVDGRDEEKSYFTNDKQDAVDTKKHLEQNYRTAQSRWGQGLLKPETAEQYNGFEIAVFQKSDGWFYTITRPTKMGEKDFYSSGVGRSSEEASQKAREWVDRSAVHVARRRAQLHPELQQADNNLRNEILGKVRYYEEDLPPTREKYAVKWDGKTYSADDTQDLVNLVIADLKHRSAQSAAMNPPAQMSYSSTATQVSQPSQPTQPGMLPPPKPTIPAPFGKKYVLDPSTNTWVVVAINATTAV